MSGGEQAAMGQSGFMRPVIVQLPCWHGVRASLRPSDHRATKAICGDTVKMEVSEPNSEWHSLAQPADNPLTKLIAMSPD
jgi:hypothetical protein